MAFKKNHQGMLIFQGFGASLLLGQTRQSVTVYSAWNQLEPLAAGLEKQIATTKPSLKSINFVSVGRVGQKSTCEKSVLLTGGYQIKVKTSFYCHVWSYPPCSKLCNS